MKICIDAGHGGKDSGAVNGSLLEKNCTLTIAKEMQLLLNKYECTTKLTRSQDEYLTLTQRTTIANNWNADFFISIHINSFTNDDANGYETHAYTSLSSADTTKATKFNNYIASEMEKNPPAFNIRGLKRSDFAVLRQTKMFALLTENGFISNASDKNKLANVNTLKAIAKAHVTAIVKLYDLKLKDNVEPPILYRVQVGAFANLDNAKKLQSELKSKGFEGIITQQ